MGLRGYRREDGRVGVRNHVVVLPVDDISNAACEAVASNIKGAMALPHSYGRLQYGESRELTLPEAGDKMMEHLHRTANGRLTAAEALGHREFVTTKLYRSA